MFVTADDGNLTNRAAVFSTSVRASRSPAMSTRALGARRLGRVSSIRLARLVTAAGAIHGAVRSR